MRRHTKAHVVDTHRRRREARGELMLHERGWHEGLRWSLPETATHMSRMEVERREGEEGWRMSQPQAHR